MKTAEELPVGGAPVDHRGWQIGNPGDGGGLLRDLGGNRVELLIGHPMQAASAQRGIALGCVRVRTVVDSHG